MKIRYTSFSLQNSQYARTCSISPDGNYVVIGQGGDNKTSSLTIWDLDSLGLVQEITQPSPLSIVCVRFLYDGKTLVYIDSSHKIYSYDLAQRTAMALDIADLNLDWLCCAEKSNRFVAAGAYTYVWDFDLNRVIWTSPDEAVSVIYEDKSTLGALNWNGTQIFLAGMEEEKIVAYDLSTNKLVRTLPDGPVNAAKWVAIDPTGKYFAAITYDDQAVMIWNLELGERCVFEDELEGFWSLAFHPSGKYLAMGKISGIVKILSLETGEVIFSDNPHTRRVCDISFSLDGKKMVTVGEGGSFLWDIEELE